MSSRHKNPQVLFSDTPSLVEDVQVGDISGRLLGRDDMKSPKVCGHPNKVSYVAVEHAAAG